MRAGSAPSRPAHLRVRLDEVGLVVRRLRIHAAFEIEDRSCGSRPAPFPPGSRCSPRPSGCRRFTVGSTGAIRAAAHLRPLCIRGRSRPRRNAGPARRRGLRLPTHPLVAVVGLRRRVRAVRRVQLPVHDHVRARRAEIGGRARLAVAEAAKELTSIEIGSPGPSASFSDWTEQHQAVVAHGSILCLARHLLADEAYSAAIR